MYYLSAHDTTCAECGGTRIIDEELAMDVCQTCGDSKLVVIGTVGGSGGDVIIQDKAQYTYVRRHHFKVLLANVQGKSSVQPSEKVVEFIKSELVRRKVQERHVNVAVIRGIMKRNGLSSQYRHCVHIMRQICPSKVPVISPQNEAKLMYMFDAIQEPFVAMCPDERKNLISYTYILGKFCQILNIPDVIDTGDKLSRHDRIWKKIIEYIQREPEKYSKYDIEWKFFASV
jgi:hypothetical protein